MSTRRKEQLLGQLRSADADARAEAADQVREHVIPSIRKTVVDQLVRHLDSRYYDMRTDTQRMLDELLWAIKGVDGYDSQECGARFRGKLKFFDAKKGFGFINPLGFDEDVYVHASNLSDAAVGEDLREGQRVEFGVEHGDKGPKALDASPLG